MKTFTQKTGKSGVLSYGLYNMYMQRFNKDDKGCDARVDYITWLRICKKFNTRKFESIVKGHVFAMPFRLGSLGIKQYKKKINFDSDGKLLIRGLITDWDKTKKLWKELYPECKTNKDYKNIEHKKIVYMTNEHTDGRVFKFHWKKKFCNIKNISAYELVIPSQLRVSFARYIRDNSNKQYCTKF